MTRYIFITGGVCSSLGKGIFASSISLLLNLHGVRSSVRKLDPYLNVDAGNLSPYQHGEVFVTDDGAEADVDLGNYERFTGQRCSYNDSVTAGKIYHQILNQEQNGDFLGNTVQTIPHVTNAIKNSILHNNDDVDVRICEIGGTVGDIEGLPFLEAIRQLKADLGSENTLFIHITWLPYVKSAGELKTKPTQHSVAKLQSCGIHPDVIICRFENDIVEPDVAKIKAFCNTDNIYLIQDADTIYDVPRICSVQGIDKYIIDRLSIPCNTYDTSSWKSWGAFVEQVKRPVCKNFTVVVVGKYADFTESYKSLGEAISHAYANTKHKPFVKYIDCSVPAEDMYKELNGCDGIIIPGGFGYRGFEGKINAILFAIDKKIPILCICYGMQAAVLAIVKKFTNIQNAVTQEQIAHINDISNINNNAKDTNGVNGSSDDNIVMVSKIPNIRKGLHEVTIESNTLIHKIYNSLLYKERFRHSYKVNDECIKVLKSLSNVKISGHSVYEGSYYVDVVELSDHPYFLAVQYHPELISSPFTPSPIIMNFIQFLSDIHVDKNT